MPQAVRAANLERQVSRACICLAPHAAHSCAAISACVGRSFGFSGSRGLRRRDEPVLCRVASSLSCGVEAETGSG